MNSVVDRSVCVYVVRVYIVRVCVCVRASTLAIHFWEPSTWLERNLEPSFLLVRSFSFSFSFLTRTPS